VDGLLVPRSDTYALAEAMRQLIEDEERREAMGRRGREKARRYDWNTLAASVVAAYEDAAGKSTPKAEDELIGREKLHSL
jgi:phosphatidylinositol alpha-mannosyltransferase